MPALIKANASLLAGNPQLTTYNISTDSTGVLTINAEFVVLSQSASTAYGIFRIGSELHSSLKAKTDVLTALSNYSASSLPVLTSAEISTVNGLATISVVYATVTIEATEDSGTVTSEITTSTDLRSFSGSVSVLETVTEDGQNVLKYVNKSFSFDYYATSITTDGPGGTGSSAGPPINMRGISPFKFVKTFTSIATRTYRNNLGAYKQQSTTTTVYIQTVFTD